MKYIYMNENVGDPDALGIAVWNEETDRLIYTKQVDVLDKHGSVIARVVFNQRPPKNMPHEATAWVEVYEYGDGNVGLL